MQVPLTPGDGYRPPEGGFGGFVVTLRRPKDQTVAREKTPRLLGIGRDQSKSATLNLPLLLPRLILQHDSRQEEWQI